MRAGAGIFYGTNKAPGLNGANNGFTNSPSWSSADNGVTSAFQWDSGFLPWQAPPFINPGFGAGFSVPWWGAGETGKLPSTASWNFAVSRVLPNKFVIDATYTGSKGTHLASDRVNIMQIDPGTLTWARLPADRRPGRGCAGLQIAISGLQAIDGRECHAGPSASTFSAIHKRVRCRNDEPQR